MSDDNVSNVARVAGYSTEWIFKGEGITTRETVGFDPDTPAVSPTPRSEEP